MTRPRARRLWVPAMVVALAALAFACVTVLRGRPDASGTTPTTSPTPTRTAAAAAGMPVGITFGRSLVGLSRAQVDAALDDVVALHMTWIRIDLSWADLQPESPDTFRWSTDDTIVASARAHGLRVLGLLTYTPAWARADGCDSFVCPPRRDAEFADFAAAVVRRYAPRGVTAYQVWNEPNITVFWRHPDPQDYGALLRTTVTALRAAHRGLTVLFGGLAQAPTDGGNIAPGAFLAQACRRGCPVDAVGYDPYTYPALPGSTTRPLNAWQQMTNPTAATYGIRAALPNGVRIWVTQYGAPTTYSGADDPRLVGEARQARILVDGLRLARQAPTVVGGYFVNTWRDSSARGGTRDHFGLERSDGTHKAAFAALQKVLAAGS